MGICSQCVHFRRVKPASQLLAAAFSTTDAAVSNALTKVVEDEQKQRDAEAEFKRLQESTDQEMWSARPVMSDFCGLKEAEGVFLIAEIKNRGGECEDFQQGRPERRPCTTCTHRIVPTGSERDRELEIVYAQMSAETIAAQASTSTTDNLLTKHREGTASRKAFELSGAYAAKGVLAVTPSYLDYCGKFSYEDEFALCLFQNPHHTCTAWEEAPLQVVPPAVAPAVEQPNGHAESVGHPAVPDTHVSPVASTAVPESVLPDPSGISEATISEFRAFVEWMLEIDLTPEQEASLANHLRAEWAEDDQDSITLVEANLATFRTVQGAEVHRQERWRQQNRAAFIKILDEYGDEFGDELVAVYRQAHSSPVNAAAPLGATSGQEMSTGQAVMGVLGLIGGAALAALAKRAEATSQVRTEIESDGGDKVSRLMDDIMEAQRKEEEELMKTDPNLALQKKLQNQQNNAMMLSNWSRVNADISKHIIGNIR